MPSTTDIQTAPGAHLNQTRVLSQIYRDIQLSGGVVTLSGMADMAKRVESQTYPYRDRGQYSVRHW